MVVAQGARGKAWIAKRKGGDGRHKARQKVGRTRRAEAVSQSGETGGREGDRAETVEGEEEEGEKEAVQSCVGVAIDGAWHDGKRDGEDQEKGAQCIGSAARYYAGIVGDLLRFLGEVLRVLHLRREWAERSPSESLFKW